MIDLNDLHQQVTTGRIAKDNVKAIMKDGRITDYYIDGEPLQASETIVNMDLMTLLANVFEI
ncbi:TPA: hypothetical protein ACUJUG_000927 [Streptococcus agalactiae]|uniref:competence regulator inhibitor paratox n=1 Tax=Streptococcus agalactiae TaxID=1311 RepID=UPI0002BC739B|nr:hypothetical protein [Streptococcus agalactiae]EPT83011.1 hypothetical protein SAG0087_07910 [Streptococcus agalactiae LMG 15091]EPU01636.1 hypothetical protein SAG0109_10280 [Streptococcus agalactiae BSU108]OCM07500.1 hypothetical protein AX213_09800 [Streptococcus agalactiae]OCM71723.1 hypothetical protein AX241_11645 [Streptococcus agalactiae]OCM72195.1 hypothetical protein AX240_11615 [Streptococcus agalactiae]